MAALGLALCAAVALAKPTEIEYGTIGSKTTYLPGDPLLWSADMTAHWLHASGFPWQAQKARRARLAGGQLLGILEEGKLTTLLAQGRKDVARKRAGDEGKLKKLEAAFAACEARGACGLEDSTRRLGRLANGANWTGDALRDRAAGSLVFSLAGDALAMPVDYLEDARSAAGDGGVAGYAAPQAYHASNVFMADLWARDDKVRSAVGFNVLHKGAAAWPEKHAHPHGLLRAGENTLERLLLRVLLRLVATQQFYFGYEYVTDYAEFMTDPESHNDSWADEGHVKFFASFRSGAEKLEDNVADSIEVANAGILSHAGAMLVAHGRNLAARGMPDAELGALLADELRHHARHVHRHAHLDRHGVLLGRVLLELLAGDDLRAATARAATELGFDAAKLAKRGARYAEDPYADLAVLRDLGVGADVAEAVPARSTSRTAARPPPTPAPRSARPRTAAAPRRTAARSSARSSARPTGTTPSPRRNRPSSTASRTATASSSTSGMTPYRDGSFDHRESEADDFLGVNFDGKSTLVELKPHRRWSTCALVAVCCASFCAVAAAAVGVAYVLEADVPYAPWGDDDDDDDSAVSSEDEAAFFSAALTTVFNPDVLEDDLSQRIIVRAAAAAMNRTEVDAEAAREKLTAAVESGDFAELVAEKIDGLANELGLTADEETMARVEAAQDTFKKLKEAIYTKISTIMGEELVPAPTRAPTGLMSTLVKSALYLGSTSADDLYGDADASIGSVVMAVSAATGVDAADVLVGDLGALGDDDVEILLDLVCDDAATAQAAAGAFHGAVDDGSLTTELRTYAASFGAAGLSASTADVVVTYLERAEATPAPAASYSYSYEDGGASAATYLAVSLDLGGTSTEELFVDDAALDVLLASVATAADVGEDALANFNVVDRAEGGVTFRCDVTVDSYDDAQTKAAALEESVADGSFTTTMQGLATDMGVDALLEATADAVTADIAGDVPPAPTAAAGTSETYVEITLDIGGTSTEELFVDDTALYVILSSVSSTMDVSDDALSNFGVADSSDGVTFTCDVAVDSYDDGETKGSALEDAVADGSFTTTMRSLATDMGADALTDATADAATYAVAGDDGSDSGESDSMPLNCAEDADCCAEQGGSCDCESGVVAFGSNGLDWEGGNPMWAYAGAAKESEIPNFKGSYLGRFPLAYAASPADCATSAFGEDPAPGYDKWCACADEALETAAPSASPTPAPTTGAPSAATRAWSCAEDAACCSEQGGACACDSGAIAYGSNGLDWSGFDPMWAYAEADSIECSTAAFGGDDPAPGYDKWCRQGYTPMWVYLEADSATCNTETFGQGDPAGGYSKWCRCVGGEPTLRPSTQAPSHVPTILAPTASAPPTVSPRRRSADDGAPSAFSFLDCDSDPNCCAESGDTCACDSGWMAYGSNGMEWRGTGVRRRADAKRRAIRRFS
ncbi:hypothetical protein JL721_3251 [Aureococcus anophagefferens]|nr:hypothetical protein JL721_3251 [Aureococcus anophagefferens]